MSEEITITPTSYVTANCDSITLRQTKTTRLLFRPMLVDNPHEEEACIRGWLVFQRKKKDGSWQDHKNLSLSNLRAEEWIKLELHSSELLLLHQKLSALYDLYNQHGIPSDTTRFIRIGTSLAGIIEADEGSFNQFLSDNDSVGLNALARLLNWATKLEDLNQVVNGLEDMDLDNFQRLSNLVDISILKNCLDVWEWNRQNSDEEFWQKFFTDNSFMLSQIFAYPVLIIQDKAFVGGKKYDNTGGKIVDFLAKNSITRNVILIEIKTPLTPLLAKEYRSDVYSISTDLSGSIVQVSNYRSKLASNYHSLFNGETIEVFNPKCVLIAGDLEISTPESSMRNSFETFRGELTGIELITYDELFGRVRKLIDLFEEEDDDVYLPF